MRHMPRQILLVWSVFVSAILLMGFALPGADFQPGDVIRASEINAKFAAIEAELTANETRPGQVRFIVRVEDDGDVFWFYDSTGGTALPQVQRPETGHFVITLPGNYPWRTLENPTFAQVIDIDSYVVTLRSNPATNQQDPEIHVYIDDIDGVAANQNFWLVVMNPVPAVP